MNRKQSFTVLILLIAVATVLAAGCAGEKSAANQSAPAVQPVTVMVKTVMVKNAGTQEVHAWITGDQLSWGGNSGNRIGPGQETTLTSPVSASDGSNGQNGGSAPEYLCIGRSEKVLTCYELTRASLPASGVLVWDGKNLAVGT